MNISHASKLRAEAKHDARQRQLLALACACVLGWPHAGGAPPPPVPTAQEELRAAKLMEAALFARAAGKEDWEKLDRTFTVLEAKYPEDAAIRNGHAEFLWSIDERQRAVDTWLAAENIDPGNATVLDHLAGCFFDAGNVKKAADYYRRATVSAPDDAAGHFSYANVLFLFRHELQDAAHPDGNAVLDEALRQFAEACRLQPLDANYARAFAETYYTMPAPDWRAALAAWQHFYDVSPQKDFALLNLARVHMKLGQKAGGPDEPGADPRPGVLAAESPVK